MSKSSRVVVVASFLVLVGGGCARDSLTFYKTTRTRTAECAIRDNGEFCAEPEQFSAPVIDVWAVEITDKIARLFVDEEVWVLDPVAEGEDPFAVERSASKASSTATGSGPCTTTTTRAVAFFADGANLAGTLKTQTVLEGPESCGNTPVGERTTDELVGVLDGP